MVVTYGNVSVARAAVDVLASAEHPLTFDELRRGVTGVLGRPVKPHTLRAAVYYHLRRDDAWFERPARGRYRLTAAGKSVGHIAR